MIDIEIRKQFRAGIIDATRDATKIIGNAIGEKEYLGHIYNWPNISWAENGMPSFTTNYGGPPDYNSVLYARNGFDASSSRSDPTLDQASFDRVEAIIFDNEFLRSRLLPENYSDSEGQLTEFAKYCARRIPKICAARYVHLFNTFTFDESLFNSIYVEFENSVLCDQLGFDLWVPILFLNFTFPDLRISETSRIVQMDEQFHASRASVKGYGSNVHECVLPCATHALVLEGWTIPNRNHHTLHQVLANPDAYPKDQVDQFFGSLRTITSATTGYCQFIARPVGWSTYWVGNLPTLYGASVHSYTSIFDNFYWNASDYQTIDVEVASTCALAFQRLQKAKQNSMAIALRRLNACYCRDDEEDLIIDATIALEALLADGTTQEMTHKLAMRAAVISQLVPNQGKSAQEVYKDIKAVYNYRSKIVHGSAPKEKDRVIGVSEQGAVATSEVAKEHLRNVLRVLIDHEEFRSGKRIDELLLSRVTAIHLPSE